MDDTITANNNYDKTRELLAMLYKCDPSAVRFEFAKGAAGEDIVTTHVDTDLVNLTRVEKALEKNIKARAAK